MLFSVNPSTFRLRLTIIPMAVRVAILLVCLLTPIFAQTPRKAVRKPPAPTKTEAQPVAPGAQAWPVGELHVKGNKLYTEQQILAIAGLRVGQMAGKAEFDAARDRLLATGAFEEVGYRFDPVPGTKANSGLFTVDEVEQLFPYRFEEVNTDEAALRAYLKSREPLFTDKLPATQPMLDRMVAHVQEFTRRNDKIIAKLDDGGTMIVFRPSSLPSVAEVSFTGNSKISTTTLQQAIAGAGVGAVYTEARFRQILDASIRPLYEHDGYLRVAFPKIEVTPSKSVTGVAVKVQVNEGDVFKLGEVKLTGELAANKELLKIGKFKSGETVNFDDVKNGVEEIRLAMRRRGYLESKVTYERNVDDAKKEVNVTINPEPGPEFFMGKLTIEGLDIETEPHIRKLWAIKKGQAFNAEYPNYFLAKLVEDQVLDNLGKTSSSIDMHPETNTVDVTIVLRGEEKAKAKRDLP